jgi:SAM-dependent methyltransferase
VRPYTRSLDPGDYAYLAPYSDALFTFQCKLAARNIPHREWHPHRLWEYASILQQLTELHIPNDAALIDVGAGASFFDPYHAQLYPRLCCTDSMKYGDVTKMVDEQRTRCNVALPLFDLLLEDMSARPEIGWDGGEGRFDVTMCISTIEHVDDFQAALGELNRITKPGGYIFITSDYFRSPAHFEQSWSRHVQVTAFTEQLVLSLPDLVGDVEFVANQHGAADLAYRGDFVNNYSFCNVCLRKAT